MPVSKPTSIKPLTGPQLYGMYVTAMAEEGVGVDPHRYLDDTDQRAWAAMARKLSLNAR